MSTQVFDFLQQPMPLRLLRVQQMQAHSDEPALLDDFARPLQNPARTAPERTATAERLLYARRRNTNAT